MEHKTLGQMIGVIRHAHSVTNDGGDKVSMTINIDCNSASDNDVRSWIASNRVIAGQRAWRALSKDELTELDNRTFIATQIGRKVKSRAEQIAVYVNMGLTQALAEIAVDDPTRFQNAMANVEAQTGDNDAD